MKGMKIFATNIEWDVDMASITEAMSELSWREAAKAVDCPPERWAELNDTEKEDFAEEFFREDTAALAKLMKLPTEVEIPGDIADECEEDDDVSDWLSDTYEFCVKGFVIEQRTFDVTNTGGAKIREAFVEWLTQLPATEKFSLLRDIAPVIKTSYERFGWTLDIDKNFRRPSDFLIYVNGREHFSYQDDVWAIKDSQVASFSLSSFIEEEFDAETLAYNIKEILSIGDFWRDEFCDWVSENYEGNVYRELIKFLEGFLTAKARL